MKKNCTKRNEGSDRTERRTDNTKIGFSHDGEPSLRDVVDCVVEQLDSLIKKQKGLRK